MLLLLFANLFDLVLLDFHEDKSRHLLGKDVSHVKELGFLVEVTDLDRCKYTHVDDYYRSKFLESG